MWAIRFLFNLSIISGLLISDVESFHGFFREITKTGLEHIPQIKSTHLLDTMWVNKFSLFHKAQFLSSESLGTKERVKILLSKP